MSYYTNRPSDPRYAQGASKNYDAVREIVRMKENPHPTLIVVATVACLLVVYFLYVWLIRATPAGDWRGLGDMNHVLTVNPITGSMTWNERDNLKLSGNTITMYGPEDEIMRQGAWMGEKIVWLNDGEIEVWEKVM